MTFANQSTCMHADLYKFMDGDQVVPVFKPTKVPI